MSTYLVVLVPVDVVFDRAEVKAFGPYETPAQAEAARRRIYFDAVQGTNTPNRCPRTYVTELEAER